MDKRTNKIKETILKFIKEISEIVNVEKVILFGSWARGEARNDSDIDIIVISKDFENMKYYRRPAQFYLKWNYPCDIDIICLTPEEFKKKRKEIGTIGEAAKEGIDIM